MSNRYILIFWTCVVGAAVYAADPFAAAPTFSEPVPYTVNKAVALTASWNLPMEPWGGACKVYRNYIDNISGAIPARADVRLLSLDGDTAVWERTVQWTSEGSSNNKFDSKPITETYTVTLSAQYPIDRALAISGERYQWERATP